MLKVGLGIGVATVVLANSTVLISTVPTMLGRGAPYLPTFAKGLNGR